MTTGTPLTRYAESKYPPIGSMNSLNGSIRAYLSKHVFQGNAVTAGFMLPATMRGHARFRHRQFSSILAKLRKPKNYPTLPSLSPFPPRRYFGFRQTNSNLTIYFRGNPQKIHRPPEKGLVYGAGPYRYQKLRLNKYE